MSTSSSSGWISCIRRIAWVLAANKHTKVASLDVVCTDDRVKTVKRQKKTHTHKRQSAIAGTNLIYTAVPE